MEPFVDGEQAAPVGDEAGREQAETMVMESEATDALTATRHILDAAYRQFKRRPNVGNEQALLIAAIAHRLARYAAAAEALSGEYRGE